MVSVMASDGSITVTGFGERRQEITHICGVMDKQQQLEPGIITPVMYGYCR